MEAVVQLDQHDPEVADHGQQHLAERLGLLLLLRDVGVTGDLGHAVDQLGHILAEHLRQRLFRRQRVFEHVVQQPDGDGSLVEPHLGQDVRDVERMDEIRFSRAPHLAAVLAGREDIGLLQQLLVEAGVVGLDLVENVFKPDHAEARNEADIVAVPRRASGERRAGAGVRKVERPEG